MVALWLAVLSAVILFGFCFSHGFLLGARRYALAFVLWLGFAAWSWVIGPWLRGTNVVSDFVQIGTPVPDIPFFVVSLGAVVILGIGVWFLGYYLGRWYRNRPPKKVDAPAQVTLDQLYRVPS